MVVKTGFFKKTSYVCSRIVYLQTCEVRDKVYYQLKNEEDGRTHFTESHQGLNKIINALKSPCSVKCLSASVGFGYQHYHALCEALMNSPA